LFSVSPATAGECSEADPCGTWAVLGADNQVVNIIVCQPSVCGSGNFWGQRVVLQVPANPVTHESQGGYLDTGGKTPSDSPTPVIYNEAKNEFTLNHKTETVKVEVVKSNEGSNEESTDVLVTKVSTNRSTFSPTVLNGTTPAMNPIIENNSSATISVTSTVVNSETTSTEEYTFVTPQTSSQIDEVITKESYPLLENYIGRIKGMLGFFIV
jgi:hypothetical protein